MSQTELKEVPVEVVLEEANKLLKAAGLTNVESRFMNRPAVMRLCGPPVEQRRISDADRIQSISKATGRYPYVVFAFRGHGGVVCIPDANYYTADGLYDVHIVDCPDGAVCAELAKYIADLFRMPKPPKEALLRLADEQSLCERLVLPSSACTAGLEPKKEEKKEEEVAYAQPQTSETSPAQAERISASTREFLRLLYEIDQYDKSGKVVPAAPPQPPSPPPDLKTLLKEQGFGWLVPAVEDASTASVVRFVLENEDLRKALQNDMRKVILEVVKSGGVVQTSPVDEALAKWPVKHREVLQKMLSKSKDLNSLMSLLLQYFFNDEHCTLDAVQFILDASRRMGLDCETAAKTASW
jgi:hypothetical protein